ncbi:hypothetical protein ACFSSB_03840 [Lacinutrix gracilariae]|uniref:Uncharacterized protein n=1 Tax=Lacinutrix gracilariae TaxID=1747198 RepID=A0ABW5JZ50_9FLAO
MNNKQIKHSITYFFIVLFLSMKMVGLHALTHEENDEHAIHCNICDHTITSNLYPSIVPDAQECTLVHTDLFFNKEVIKQYRFTYTNNIATNRLFCRPPPFSL